MTLYDDNRNPDSTLETMTPEHDSHNGGSAVLDAPETVQPSPAETQASAPDAAPNSAQDSAPTPAAETHETPATPATASSASAPEAPAAASDDFAAALENFTTETEESVGDDHVIKGTVVKLTGTHVVVDFGSKSEGMLPLSEVLDHEGQPRFKPGDEIDVMREKGETEDGYPKLSHQKAQRLRAWDDIEKAHNEKRPIKGVVVERIKGGLTVDINGARAFLPGSQVDLRPIRNLDGMKGQTIEVAVIKLNKKRGNIVVSRKQLLEEEQSEKRGKTLEHLEEGAVLTGIVKNLTEYGAFVDMGGIDGLLHITDMSWGRLTHPRDLVNVGDQIQVKVLKYDKDKQRVSLGFKQLTPDPWLDAEHR
jgi:small subunit ribosomal protein S1